MSNHPHQRPEFAHVPAGLSANGHGRQLPPPPPDAAPDVAQAIGQAVAMALGPMLAQISTAPACVLCIAEHKKAEAAYLEALKSADQETGQVPPASLPQVQKAVTWIPLGLADGQGGQAVLPVCYTHFSLGPEVRSVGLVDAGGNPILVRGAAA